MQRNLLDFIRIVYKNTLLILLKTSTYSLILLFLLFGSTALAQTDEESSRKVLQFTGVVFASDSATVIPGVHVYVPKGGRGTTSNPYGFFSMPVLEGDSIVFSAVSFERSYYIVPDHEEDHSLKLLMYLSEDTTYLREVEIFPYPSEATFKAAVLAAELPDQREVDEINRWLSSDVMSEMYEDMPYTPSMNARYFMQQQQAHQNRRYGAQANPLLNPFAWASFIRSLKNR
jgi:hypothetical protein